MTVTNRRIAYSVAFLVFFVAAPLVVATTLGYRWGGWPVGFTRTGSIVITSQPRATLTINGQSRGPTPRRISGLTPGVYSVRLQHPGYSPWEALIDVGQNIARVLGPVTLFPSQFTVTPMADNLTQLIADLHQTALVDVEPYLLAQSASWGIHQVWPANRSAIFSLSNKPKSLIRGPRGQAWVFTTAGLTEIRLSDRPETAWAITPVQSLAWSQSSDQVFFGLRDGRLQRFDILTKTEEILGSATSLATSGETLWFTRSLTSTELWRQSALGQSTAERVALTAGNWEIQTGPDNRLWWRNPETREAELLTYNSLTRSLGRQPIGRLDRMFWNAGHQPPIWQDGVNLYAWINDRPLLLERSPNIYQALYWLEAPHILLAVEANQVAIKSVSSRQGQHELMVAPLSESDNMVSVNPAQKQFLIYDRPAQTLRQYRWDQPNAN